MITSIKLKFTLSKSLTGLITSQEKYTNYITCQVMANEWMNEWSEYGMLEQLMNVK